MYVVRVDDFLGMTRALPHQELTAAGVAVEYALQHGPAIFVSHQWCGNKHPDPHFQQLLMLQAILRNAARSRVKVRVDLFSKLVFKLKVSVRAGHLYGLRGGCIWYDYFSVPQPPSPSAESKQHLLEEQSLRMAVMSIPGYVAMCDFFFILAPPVQHVDHPEQMVDFRSWKSRGWCRMERIARVLSPAATHMLLVANEETLVQVGAQDYLMDPVGEGAFAVASDRALLAPVLAKFLSQKLQTLLHDGEIDRYRRLLSMSTIILRGLPEVTPPQYIPAGLCYEGDAVCRFLHLYGFQSATDRTASGVDPILFAARSGDADVVFGLLERKASLDSREPRQEPEFMVVTGSSVLHRACAASKHPELVERLLQARADLHAEDFAGLQPLSIAAMYGHTLTVGALLAAKADVYACSCLDADALAMAAMMGRHVVVEQLLSAAPPASVRPGCALDPLFLAAVFGGGPDTLLALTRAAGCDVDMHFRPASVALKLALRVLSLPHAVWGSRAQLSLLGYHAWGATPLMGAAIMGNVAEARALLAAKADAAARNARSKTARELAALASVSPLNMRFLLPGGARPAEDIN